MTEILDLGDSDEEPLVSDSNLFFSLPTPGIETLDPREDARPLQTSKKSILPKKPEVIVLDSESEEEPAGTCKSEQEDHFAEGGQQALKTSSGPFKRKQEYGVRRGTEIKRCILLNKDRVATTNTVELKRKGRDVQEFLLVQYVSKEETQNGAKFWLTGFKLHRNEDSDGQLPYGNSGATELFLLLRCCQNNGCGLLEQSLEVIPAESAVRKRSCIMTNHLYPAKRSVSKDMLGDIPLSQDILVCRWMQIFSYTDTAAKLIGKIAESCLRRLDRDLCDPGYSIPDVELRRTAAKGSSAGKSTVNTVDLAHETSKIALSDQDSNSNEKIYTSGEGFGGAGCASWALEKAGFKAEWVFDNWKQACESHDMNFTKIKCHHMTHEHFIKRYESAGPVDLLHLSPPCPWCSRMNTQADGGHNYEHQRDCFLATGRLVDIARCRILTLEEVDGILDPRHAPHFRSVIHDLTSRNYCVRWKIVRMNEYGLVHERKRLILFAAALGEILPPFPKPTHGHSAGLEKPTTIETALRNVNFVDDLHDVEEAIYEVRRHVYPANRPLRACVLTKGTAESHPSGIRRFTLAELREFQGFPRHHKFSGTSTEILRQIGNALPATVFIHFTKMCMKALRKTDRKHCEMLAPATYDPGSSLGQSPLFDPPKNSIASSISSAVTRKRPADSMSTNAENPSTPKKRSRITGIPPTPPSPPKAAADDMALSEISDISMRNKISQIRAELPDQRVVDCFYALQKSKGNLVSAVAGIVRRKEKKMLVI